MSDIEKEQVLEAWTSGRVPCIVATIAFGMVSLSHAVCKKYSDIVGYR